MEHDQAYKIRHTLAHVLAAAVLKKDPQAKLAIGPVIDNGFYYDFEFSKDGIIGEADLPKLEKEMRKIIERGFEVTGEEKNADEARDLLKDQPYKLELIDELVSDNQTITFYTLNDFVDLCAGGHVESASEIPKDAFMLTHIAGAYWRGDEKNTMLTRIYGVAFESSDELEAYKEQQKAAKERDHRKLGKELDLFTFSDLVGSGLPLFTPKGTLMRDLIVDKIMSIQSKFGYERVTIPHITKKDLYETSGHWDKFGDELFKVTGKQDAQFVMKPMNCPHHTQIYSSRPRSYRDLPIRYAETTMVYRDEQQGELIGLGRVRSISQDDGHAFVRPDQIEQEVENIIEVIREFYTALDMFKPDNYWVSLSVRDPETPEKYLGDKKRWDEAEEVLEKVAKKLDLPYKRVEGEAAFYGPKLDFMFYDALGRERQLATAQLDFVMPERFELSYVDSDGSHQRPVMIHRAIAGSLERFMAIMIEHFAGAFPLWLSPVQLKVLPIGESQRDYAKDIAEKLKEHGFRVILDDESESLGKKIRSAKLEKVPYFLVIGDKEVAEQQVTVESRGDGDSETMSIDALIEKLKAEAGV